MGEIWLEDPNPVSISVFDEVFGPIFKNGNYERSCTSNLDCQKFFLAVGPTGDLYPCCLFQGYEEFSYGNILRIDLEDIVNTPTWKRMIRRKEYIKKMCSDCFIYNYCYGGCPFIAYSTYKTINMKYYYCDSYRQFIITLMKSFERKMKSFKGDKL